MLPTAASAAAGAADTGGAGVERISVATDGAQADDNSTGASITPDGRYIVYASSATNLAPGATETNPRVYLRDQRAGQTTGMGRFSPDGQPPAISSNGVLIAYSAPQIGRVWKVRVPNNAQLPADCVPTCNQPSWSTDGRYLAFATNQRPNQTPGQRIEIEDQASLSIETIAHLDNSSPSRPSISGDGRYVAYQDGQAQDVLLWDRNDSSTSDPIEGPGVPASIVQLSDNGRKIVYLSGTDTYVHDIPNATTQQVSNVRGIAIDPTGRYLLYAPNDAGGPALTLRDLQTGTDEAVSDQPASAGTDSVSSDGRDVVFQSTADDIVPGDTNGKSDIFIRRFY
ncbi:hypothetical protein [Streptomyces sp. NPDC046862]|uniref:TolB family protein n=1 Tax=Streptomyces sp. NPDC046862 TaxID=3154603 RepID=UPI00345683BC